MFCWSGDQQRRNRLERNANPEIRCSPDDAHHDPGGVGRCFGGHDEGSNGLLRRGDETISCDGGFGTQADAVSTLLFRMIQSGVGARDDRLRVDLGR